jgi:hypothetical protein
MQVCPTHTQEQYSPSSSIFLRVRSALDSYAGVAYVYASPCREFPWQSKICAIWWEAGLLKACQLTSASSGCTEDPASASSAVLLSMAFQCLISRLNAANAPNKITPASPVHSPFLFSSFLSCPLQIYFNANAREC